MISAAKGTPEYDAVMKRLMETNYAHQKEEKKQPDEEESESDEEVEEVAGPEVKKDRSMSLIRRQKTINMAVENWEEKQKLPQFRSQNDGWCRIFSLYKPYILVLVMVILALGASSMMPVISFTLGRMKEIFYAGEACMLRIPE